MLMQFCVNTILLLKNWFDSIEIVLVVKWAWITIGMSMKETVRTYEVVLVLGIGSKTSKTVYNNALMPKAFSHETAVLDVQIVRDAGF